MDHTYLLAEQGEPAAGWMRRGPAALTRAWCIFELAKSLSKGCTLHVLLGETSVGWRSLRTRCATVGGGSRGSAGSWAAST